MDRNRIILKVFQYWHSRLHGDRLPSRADILPGELREWLPFLFMADVNRLTPIGTGINLRLAGTHIGRALGLDLTGCPVGGMAKHWQDFTVGRDLFEAANKRIAIVATHELRGTAKQLKGAAGNANTAGKEATSYVRYHRVVLPLALDGIHVDRIMGALVAEVSENISSLWQGPYEFHELSRRVIAAPPCGSVKSIAIPERRVPV